MGSASAMNSIDRVLKTHSEELIDEVEKKLPVQIKALDPIIHLKNDVYNIGVIIEFKGGSISLEPYDIDDLAERFPDCEVGY